jgi:preprotein translocase subunit YajC
MPSIRAQGYLEMNSAQLVSTLTQIAPLVAIFGVFYWLMIRPQQQKQRELRAQIAAVKRGDRVVTSGGILGTVAKVRDGIGEVEVDIAPNVRVVVLRDTLTAIIAPVAANDGKPA